MSYQFYHIFLHYFINGTTFGKKVSELKMCFVILYYFGLKHLSFYEELFDELF